MAELETRIESEEDCKEQLAELSLRYREELLVRLGNPPDPRNVPEAYWQDFQIALRAAIFIILYETFMNAARMHGMMEDDAAARARRFATTRATLVAKGFVNNTRELLARAWRKWDAQIAAMRSDGAKQELPQAEVRTHISDYVASTVKSDVDAIFGEARNARVAQHEFSVAQAEGAEEAAENFEAENGIKLERWWRHSAVRPPWHSNAPHAPCEICSVLENTKAPWVGPYGETRPGLAHIGCDCYTEYVNPITGKIWGGDAVAMSDLPLSDSVWGSGSTV